MLVVRAEELEIQLLDEVGISEYSVKEFYGLPDINEAMVYFWKKGCCFNDNND